MYSRLMCVWVCLSLLCVFELTVECEWTSVALCARDSGEIKLWCYVIVSRCVQDQFFSSFCFVFPLIKRYTQETQIILNSVVVCVSLQCDDDDDLYLGYTQSTYQYKIYSLTQSVLFRSIFLFFPLFFTHIFCVLFTRNPFLFIRRRFNHCFGLFLLLLCCCAVVLCVCVNLCMRVFTREIYRWLNGSLVVSLNATYGTHQCSNKHTLALCGKYLNRFVGRKKKKKTEKSGKKEEKYTPKKVRFWPENNPLSPRARTHFTYISFAYSFVQFPNFCYCCIVIGQSLWFHYKFN